MLFESLPSQVGYDLFIKSGSTGRLSNRPAVSLKHGTDYVCRDGWLELLNPVRTTRKTERSYHESQAVVRLYAAGRSGLTLAVRFSGGQPTVIYDRLRFSTPGTGIVLNESFRWPDISEPAPPSVDSTTPAPVPKDVASVRKRLANLVSPLSLAGLSSAAGGVRATFTPRKSHDVARFEERMRDAGIGYLVRVQPVWSATNFHFELLIPPEGSVQAWRPSVLWVE